MPRLLLYYIIEIYEKNIIDNLINGKYHKIKRCKREILYNGIRSLAINHFNVSDDVLSNIEYKLNPNNFIPINKLETDVALLLDRIRTLQNKNINIQPKILNRAIDDIDYYNKKIKKAIKRKKRT